MARNWDNLSATYRQRLERGGITRAAYESGASVSAARGHAATPEHPSQATRNPERFQAYLFKRDELIQNILRIKASRFGAMFNYNATRSRWNVNNFINGKTRSIESLRRVEAALKSTSSNNWDELIEDLEEEDINALYYH